MSNTLTILPKAAVNGYLRALRLPLDVVASVANRDKDAEWPPALAFDAFEAQVKGLLGSILRDEDLLQEASRERTRIDQLRRAMNLEAEAEARRQQADQELAQRREQAQQKAETAEELAEQREQRLEQEKAEAKRRVQNETAEKKQKARKAADARQDRIDDIARDADEDRIRAEREALAERKEALEATGDALELDKAAAAVKEARKASK